MSAHPARVAASLLLFVGAFVAAVSALAIGVAKLLVDGGLAVDPSDAALLGDLVAVLPLVIGFALVNVIAGVGLVAGSTWADSVAVATAGVAVVAGSLGLVLVVAGRDPFAPVGVSGPSSEGLGILAVFTGVYLLVLVALAAARPRATSLMGANA